jgi:hypothetical protein
MVTEREVMMGDLAPQEQAAKAACWKCHKPRPDRCAIVRGFNCMWVKGLALRKRPPCAYEPRN